MREVVFKVTEMFPFAGDIPLRSEGFSISIRMQKALSNDTIVVIDFDGIRNISRGFGDEIIGTFIRNGIDLIDSKHIKFVNTNDRITNVISWVRNNPEDAINWL
jgi:hypothetical protein